MYYIWIPYVCSFIAVYPFFLFFYLAPWVLNVSGIQDISKVVCIPLGPFRSVHEMGAILIDRVCRNNRSFSVVILVADDSLKSRLNTTEQWIRLLTSHQTVCASSANTLTELSLSTLEACRSFDQLEIGWNNAILPVHIFQIKSN